MATQLDLQEQEQIDSLKHFWRQYGNFITVVLILVLGGFAAFNGWQYWQTRQAASASVMFDELQRTAVAGEREQMDRIFADLRNQYPGTAQAAQAGLRVAQVQYAAQNAKAAQEALTWVAANARDDGVQAVARLRLASLLLEEKAYDAALAQLAGSFPPAFAPLVADRRGDVLLLQGKKDEARTAFEQAYKDLPATGEYRRVVEIKLNSLGVEVNPATPGAARSAS